MDEMNENNNDMQMEKALSEMMQIDTPILDLVSSVFRLPIKLLLSPIGLYAFGQGALGALLSLNFEGLLEVGGVYLEFFVIGAAAKFGTGAIRDFEKDITEGSIRDKLVRIFRDKGLMIHTFSRGKSIPDYLINHTHLIHGFSSSAGGDLITLHYRGYVIACCNIALTQPRTPLPDGNALQDESSENSSKTEVFVDQYKQDDIEASERFSISDGQDVIFYGSVFFFIPGPDIKGRVYLEDNDPIEYLKELKTMSETDILTNPERKQVKEEVFDYHHRVYGENKGDTAETDSVLTQRVKDMVLQLELDLRAPVGVYADRNMVCLTIQKKVFDFDNEYCFMESEVRTKLENTLIEKAVSFKKILDVMIGPKGNEYTELFGSPAEQRNSVYSTLLDPAYLRTIPTDEEIEAYVDDLVQYHTDLYRFFLQHSGDLQREFKCLKLLAKQFIVKLYSFEDKADLTALIRSNSGKIFMDRMTKSLEGHLRKLWDQPDKHAVKGISHTKSNIGEDIINIEIGVNPTIREWNYEEGIDRLVDLMSPYVSAYFTHFERVLNDAGMQNSFYRLLEDNLSIAYELKYDDEYEYTIKMTLIDDDHFGFAKKEMNEFQAWYLELLMSNMNVKGVEFKLNDGKSLKIESEGESEGQVQ